LKCLNDIDHLGKYKEFAEVTENNTILESYYGMKYYQALPVRYFKPYNKKIKRILIYHSTGTGKTFVALWIINSFLNVFNKKALILVKNKETIIEFKKKIAKWYRYNYTDFTRPNAYQEFTDKNIEFNTYNSFCSNIKSMEDEYFKIKDSKELFRVYDKRLIIIDEFHHFRNSEDKLDKKMFRILSQFLSIIKNGRVVFLSATPIFDNSDEIKNLIKFINPEVNTKYISPNDIYPLLKGRVSYYSPENAFIKQYYMGEVIPGISKKIVKIPMKGKQLDFYKSSINCINPYGIDYVKASLGYPVQEEKKNTSDTSKSTNKYVWNVEKGIVNTNPEIQKQLEYYCQDLDQFNCKLNYFLEQINCNNPINGPVFIYCNLVDGTGINYIAALLSCLGYYYVHSFSHLNEVKKAKERRDQFNKEINVNEKIGKKYWNFTFISGDKQLCPNLNERLQLFNSQENVHGELIKILIGSEVTSEALDIKNVRQVHIFTPHWNYERIHQVIGRTCRLDTHEHLPPEERFIQIYIYMAYNPNIPCQNDAKYSIDYKKLYLSEIKKKYSDSVIQFIRNSSIESIIKKNRLEEFQDLKDLTYSNDYKTYIKTSITSIIFDKLNELFQQGHSAISTSELTKQCKKFPHNIVLMSIQYFCRRKIQFIIQNTPYLLKMINYTLYLEPIYHSFIPQSVLGSTTPLTSTIPITISSSSTNNNTNTNTNVNTDSGTNDANITFSDINSLTHQMKNIALVNSPTLFNLIESKDSKKESSSYQKYELPAILFNNLIYNAYRTKNYLKVYDFLEGYTKLEHCYLLEYALIHHLKFIKKFYEAYWLQENSTFYISLFISFSNHSFNTHGKLIQNTSHQTWIESPINPYYFNYYHDIFSSSSSSSSSTTTTSSTIRSRRSNSSINSKNNNDNDNNHNNNNYNNINNNINKLNKIYHKLKKNYNEKLKERLGTRQKFIYLKVNDLDLYFQISLSIKSQNSDNNNSNNSNKSIPVTELHNNIKSSSTNKTDLLEEEDEHFIASLIYSLCFDEIENDINSDYLITKENNLNNIISKIKYYCQQETNAIQKVIHHVTQEDIEDYCQNRPKQAHILYNILEMIHGRMISPDQFYQFSKTLIFNSHTLVIF